MFAVNAAIFTSPSPADSATLIREAGRLGGTAAIRDDNCGTGGRLVAISSGNISGSICHRKGHRTGTITDTRGKDTAIVTVSSVDIPSTAGASGKVGMAVYTDKVGTKSGICMLRGLGDKD